MMDGWIWTQTDLDTNRQILELTAGTGLIVLNISRTMTYQLPDYEITIPDVVFAKGVFNGRGVVIGLPARFHGQ